jgi:hypothetical protein
MFLIALAACARAEVFINVQGSYEMRVRAEVDGAVDDFSWHASSASPNWSDWLVLWYEDPSTGETADVQTNVAWFTEDWLGEYRLYASASSAGRVFYRFTPEFRGQAESRLKVEFELEQATDVEIDPGLFGPDTDAEIERWNASSLDWDMLFDLPETFGRHRLEAGIYRFSGRTEIEVQTPGELISSLASVDLRAFEPVPEPMSVAVLGFGALALYRRGQKGSH